MRQILVSLMALLIFHGTVAAGGPGSTSANFLKAGQGVRPIAMGETYIALGDGLDTLYWNPAGLVQITSPQASFMHNFWFQDIGTEYLAYGMPLGPLGAVAGGLTVMHAGTVVETLEDEYGNYLGTGDEIRPLSFALVGTYAQKLSRIILYLLWNTDILHWLHLFPPRSCHPILPCHRFVRLFPLPIRL